MEGPAAPTWAGPAVGLHVVVRRLGVQTQVADLSVQLLQLGDQASVSPSQAVLRRWKTEIGLKKGKELQAKQQSNHSLVLYSKAAK